MNNSRHKDSVCSKHKLNSSWVHCYGTIIRLLNTADVTYTWIEETARGGWFVQV